MIQKLSKQGDSLVLVFDRAMLEHLGIDEQTALDVSTDGQKLVVAPMRDPERVIRFEQALGDANERFGAALKRLAE